MRIGSTFTSKSVSSFVTLIPGSRANAAPRNDGINMASLDTISIAILLGSLLVLAGILSSLIALRFGAPLLLVFLLLGMLAGEGGPGGLKFDSVRTAYTVGSIALALILFDGGLRTRLATFRNVLAPATTLATVGVLITTLLTAPVAKLALGISWMQALLVGAVVASTDAAAVFLLINTRGLRLRPRVRATLEVESGTNDPFAVFLTLLLVEFLLAGDHGWAHAMAIFLRDTVLGCIIGSTGGWIITYRAQPAQPAAGLARALRRGQRAGRVRRRQYRAFLGLPRGLSRRAGRRQPADARAQFRRRVSRCRHLAGADRDVRAARPVGVAAADGRQPVRLRHCRADADAGGAAGFGVPVSRPLRLPMARETVRVLGRLARRGGDFPCLHSAAGRIADRLSCSSTWPSWSSCRRC